MTATNDCQWFLPNMGRVLACYASSRQSQWLVRSSSIRTKTETSGGSHTRACRWRASVVAKGQHGVDSGGAAGRDPAC